MTLASYIGACLNILPTNALKEGDRSLLLQPQLVVNCCQVVKLLFYLIMIQRLDTGLPQCPVTG